MIGMEEFMVEERRYCQKTQYDSRNEHSAQNKPELRAQRKMVSIRLSTRSPKSLSEGCQACSGCPGSCRSDLVPYPLSAIISDIGDTGAAADSGIEPSSRHLRDSASHAGLDRL